MPGSQEAGSITDKQKHFLERLVGDREEFDEPWFEELKTGTADIEELSVAQASEYLDALLNAKPKESTESTKDQASGERSSSNEPKPLSEKQEKFIRQLLDMKQLAEDGMIDVDTLLSRLTTRSGAHFIDALKHTEDKQEKQAIFD